MRVVLFEERSNENDRPWHSMISAAVQPNLATWELDNWWKLVYIDHVTIKKGKSIAVFLFRWLQWRITQFEISRAIVS